MSEYIERDKALDCFSCDLSKKDYSVSYQGFMIEAAFRINDIPAADVRPVVRGKWGLGGYGQISNATEKWYDKYLQGGFLYCSVCKGRTSVKYNFCPNCGADMRDANDEKA